VSSLQTESTNRYNNSGYQENKVYKKDTNTKRKCSYCNGTGKCRTCNRVFSIVYHDSHKMYYQNETRLGWVRCETCSGAGMTDVKRSSISGDGNPTGKTCYICNGNRWVTCKDCNPNGQGNYLGLCKYCKGEGYRY
jgi:hypothetical protein